jgi:GH43 family beta-xylosidase
MDPHGNSWEFMGPVRGLDQRQFAIDSTVIMIDGRHYLVYSAQSLDQIEHKESEPDQQLFIAPLFDPVTVASTPVMICRPDRPFERYRDRGFVEGPQWLESPDSFWQGIAYSCSANWTKESKINTLRFLGGSPLEPRSWQKSDVPLLQSGTHGPYGPGLGCFLNFKDSTVAFFHTTDNENDGASGRKCKMQRVRWTAGGPCMDQVVGPVTRDVALFTKAMNGFSAGVGTHAGQSSDLFVPMDVAQALVEEGSAAPRNTFLNIL